MCGIIGKPQRTETINSLANGVYLLLKLTASINSYCSRNIIVLQYTAGVHFCPTLTSHETAFTDFPKPVYQRSISMPQAGPPLSNHLSTFSHLNLSFWLSVNRNCVSHKVVLFIFRNVGVRCVLRSFRYHYPPTDFLLLSSSSA